MCFLLSVVEAGHSLAMINVLHRLRMEERCAPVASASEHMVLVASQGSCKKVQSFSGMTTAQKQQLAEECKAPWLDQNTFTLASSVAF